MLGRRERVGLLIAGFLGLIWCASPPAAGLWLDPSRDGVLAKFRDLQRHYALHGAAALERSLLEADDGEWDAAQALLCRLGSLHATRGQTQEGVRVLRETALRTRGTALEARSQLALAHVLRRSKDLLGAQEAYRVVLFHALARPEERDEARAWWIRGLCELDRHAQAQEEWKSLATFGATDRWRNYAGAWLLRCEAQHR